MLDVLAGRIKASRERAGLSQAELADMLNTDKVLVSKWERGVTVPGAVNLDALADALGVSVDYLLGRTDDPRGAVDHRAPATAGEAKVVLVDTLCRWNNR